MASICLEFFDPYSATSLFPDNTNNWFTLFGNCLGFPSGCILIKSYYYTYSHWLKWFLSELRAELPSKNDCTWVFDSKIYHSAISIVPVAALSDTISAWFPFKVASDFSHTVQWVNESYSETFIIRNFFFSEQVHFFLNICKEIRK